MNLQTAAIIISSIGFASVGTAYIMRDIKALQANSMTASAQMPVYDAATQANGLEALAACSSAAQAMEALPPERIKELSRPIPQTANPSGSTVQTVAVLAKIKVLCEAIKAKDNGH